MHKNEKKGVIIQASARSNGNTTIAVNALQKATQFDVIDLNQKHIKHFNYQFNNKEDDFNALFKNIVKNYETIVFATPIYWYTMSGLLKVFLDRISDFLFNEKEIGRQLRGMNMALISCGNEQKKYKNLKTIFKETATYLSMNFLAYKHLCIQGEKLTNKSKKQLKKLAFMLTPNTKHQTPKT